MAKSGRRRDWRESSARAVETLSATFDGRASGAAACERSKSDGIDARREIRIGAIWANEPPEEDSACWRFGGGWWTGVAQGEEIGVGCVRKPNSLESRPSVPRSSVDDE